MKVGFLGTSGAFPTLKRNVSAYVVWVKGYTILMDCGEGTQRQLHASSMRFSVDMILITHLHFDHILGIPGYVWTMGLLQRKHPLYIYTPVGTKSYIESLIGAQHRLCYELHIVELKDGEKLYFDGFTIETATAEHVGHSLAYRIEEDIRPGKVDMLAAKAFGLKEGPQIGALLKGEPVFFEGKQIDPKIIIGPPRIGRSLVYAGDTRPCQSVIDLARNASLLIHEAMFLQSLQDEAIERKHSTSIDAATVALKADVSRLAITHLSHRHQEYSQTQTLLSEAKSIFSNTILPDDLFETEIELNE